MKKVRVWDLPTRLFHWALALLIGTALVTEKIGGNAMEWHFRAGYTVLALLAFRIVWGLVGSRYARFKSFVYHPSEIIVYLRGNRDAFAKKYLGHNPLGSLSVFALLGVLLTQAVSGLFANDDIAYDGPLVRFISKEWSDRITWFHTEISATLIYVLVGLHLVAVAFYYLRRRQNLVAPMITGDRVVDFDAAAANDSWAIRLFALTLFGVCALGVYLLVSLPASSV